MPCGATQLNKGLRRTAQIVLLLQGRDSLVGVTVRVEAPANTPSPTPMWGHSRTL